MTTPGSYPSQSTNCFHGVDTATFEDGIKVENPFDYDDHADAGTIHERLIAESIAARSNLLTIGTELTEAALAEGNPSKDITTDPKYVKALGRLSAAIDAINEFQGIKDSN